MAFCFAHVVLQLFGWRKLNFNNEQSLKVSRYFLELVAVSNQYAIRLLRLDLAIHGLNQLWRVKRLHIVEDCVDELTKLCAPGKP